jgi:hypothetical protein
LRTSVFVGFSIDGFIARLDGFGHDELMASVDAMVVGRATHETVLGFGDWPWTGKRVVVLTHRPLAA